MDIKYAGYYQNNILKFQVLCGIIIKIESEKAFVHCILPIVTKGNAFVTASSLLVII